MTLRCFKRTDKGLRDSFAGWMAYNRFWFDKDKLAITVGGGRIDNPGGYLTLLPPINGANGRPFTVFHRKSRGARQDVG